MGKPRSNRQWAQDVETRLNRLENSLYPWQVVVGAHGDLMAYNLETGARHVLAARTIDSQVMPGGGA